MTPEDDGYVTVYPPPAKPHPVRCPLCPRKRRRGPVRWHLCVAHSKPSVMGPELKDQI